MVRCSARLGLLSAAMLATMTSVAAPAPTSAPLFLLASTTISATPDPAQQFSAMARSFRNNDLGGFLRAVLPDARYVELRDAYETHRVKEFDDEDREKFSQKWGELTAPGAVDTLMAEIEPKLAVARPKAQGAILMAAGALQMAAAGAGDELTPSQRESLQAVLPGLQAWLSRTDFLSEQTMREALDVVTQAARGTGIRTLEDVRAMTFEQVLARAGNMLGAGKEALSLYGLDINAIVDSLRVEVLEISGDRAKVRTTVTLFEAPISTEHELRLVEGRWGGPKGFVGWKLHHDHDHDHDDVEVDVKVEADVDA